MGYDEYDHDYGYHSPYGVERRKLAATLTRLRANLPGKGSPEEYIRALDAVASAHDITFTIVTTVKYVA